MDVAFKQKKEEKPPEQHAKEEKKRKLVPLEFFAPSARQQAQHQGPQPTHVKTFFGDKLIESHVHRAALPFERAKEKFVDKKGKQARGHVVRVMKLIDKIQEKSREVLWPGRRKRTKGKDK
ncbi:MAG: hypothetical protein AB1468_01595 [Candidatus Micrarchaeota archaeon]